MVLIIVLVYNKVCEVKCRRSYNVSDAFLFTSLPFKHIYIYIHIYDDSNMNIYETYIKFYIAVAMIICFFED